MKQYRVVLKGSNIDVEADEVDYTTNLELVTFYVKGKVVAIFKNIEGFSESKY